MKRRPLMALAATMVVVAVGARNVLRIAERDGAHSAGHRGLALKLPVP
jgi:hypothetical protein